MSGSGSPPEIAVALRYDGRGAPQVTATGRAELAQAIRRVAAEHGVPLYENAELALALSHVELGDEIPEMLYRAVAEVIAFAYLLSGRSVPPGRSEQEPP
jgi:flagellar biosynthesis protein